MAEHWVDTTNPGGDSGHAIGDAWQSIDSWITHAKIAADICYVRGNGQIHTVAGDKAWAGDGTFGDPAITRGDEGTIWGGDDATYPIIDFAANNNEWVLATDHYFRFERIRFRDGEGRTIELNNASGCQFNDCQWEDDSGETPSQMLYAVNADGLRITNCTLGMRAGTGVYVQKGTYIRDSTIDNCTTEGFRHLGGASILENIVFGGTTANTADIRCDRGQVIGRNVTFNAATEVNISSVTEDIQDTFVAIEDYDGVKGAWKKWYYHGILSSTAAAGTPDGKRAGGTDVVVQAVANGNGSVYAPLMCREWPVYVGAAAQYDVTVYIQPDNGDASVPDTQGSDADIWCEVAAWDAGNSEYLYFDSRDKAAQNAQVDETWGDIVVENVDVDAVGWIIIRIYCLSTDTFYIDRTETIA